MTHDDSIEHHHQVVLEEITGCCNESVTGPISPDGRSGESAVKNLKHPTVFLPSEGRLQPLTSHSGLDVRYRPAMGFPGA